MQDILLTVYDPFLYALMAYVFIAYLNTGDYIFLAWVAVYGFFRLFLFDVGGHLGYMLGALFNMFILAVYDTREEVSRPVYFIGMAAFTSILVNFLGWLMYVSGASPVLFLALAYLPLLMVLYGFATWSDQAFGSYRRERFSRIGLGFFMVPFELIARFRDAVWKKA